MMKYFILFFIVSLNVFADTEDTCLNPRSGISTYFEDSFCNCAQYYAKKLPKSENYTVETNQINSLKKQIEILNNIEQMRNDYVTSFKNLTPNDLKQTAGDRLKSYNKTLVSGALLKTIDAFFKMNADELNKGTFNYKNYCDDKKNADNSICKIKNDQKLANLYGFLGNSIDKFVASYNAAKNGNDSQSFNDAIKSLVNSIPEDMDPKIVFSTLKNISPETKDLINKLNADAIKCAENITDEQNCKKAIVLTDEDNKNIIEQLTLPTPTSTQAIMAIDTAQLNNVEMAIKNQLTIKIQNGYDKVVRNFPEKIEQLKGIDPKLMSFLSEDKKKRVNEKLTMIKENCGINKISSQSNQVEINNCYSNFNELFNSLTDNTDINNLNKQISDFQKKLDDKMKKNNSNDLLKKYLATKYYRQCSDSNMEISTKDVGSCGISKTTEVTDLKIAGEALQIAGKLSNSDELDFTFSKKEIREFQDACPRNPNKDLKAICMTLQSEVSKTKNGKDSKYWEDFHKKNDIVYDKDGNARAVPKQSNASIYAGAAIPVLVQSIPNWLNLYGQSMQIDAMAQQAVYQKQWMSDMNIINNAYLNNIYFPSMLAAPSSTVGGFNFSATSIGASAIGTSAPASTSVFKGFSF